MAVPNIQISDAAARSVHSLRGAVHEDLPLDAFIPLELPSPARSYISYKSTSPSPSPIAPFATLSLPSSSDVRSPSCVSFASSETLTGRETPQSPITHCDTVFGGPLTADPDPITAGPEALGEGEIVTASPARRRLSMAPSPMSLFIDGSQSRYQRKPIRELDGFATIPPWNELPARERPGGRWESFVHPEGNRYFRYKMFFTNEDLHDPSEDYGKLHYVESLVERIMEDLSRYPSIRLEDIEVGILLMTDEDNDELGCHYFVDTKLRRVFYLDEVPDAFFFPDYGTKILSRDHLDQVAEQLYWEHVFMFPHRRKLTRQDCCQLQGDLLWYVADRETSAGSAAPYAADELHRFQAIARDIMNEHGDALPQHMVVFARLKSTLLISSFRRYYGEYCAQLDSYKSQYGECPEPATIFKIVSWLFFFTPHIYLERLRRVWVDHIVNHQHWRKLLAELQEDWTASITPATVILTTNVGFLAIQSVDQGGTAYPDRTVGQLLSYISTVLSIGNIVACTILARQHRVNAYAYCAEAAEYLAARAFTHQGTEMLAIVYAIPTAFFLWALLTFFLAVGWVCFDNTSAVTRCIVGLSVVFSTLLLSGVVYNGNWQIQRHVVAAFKERRDRTVAMVKNAKRVPRKLSSKIRRLSTMLKAKTKTFSEPRPAEQAEGRPMAKVRASRELFPRPKWTRRYSMRRSVDTILPFYN